MTGLNPTGRTLKDAQLDLISFPQKNISQKNKLAIQRASRQYIRSVATTEHTTEEQILFLSSEDKVAPCATIKKPKPQIRSLIKQLVDAQEILKTACYLKL